VTSSQQSNKIYEDPEDVDGKISIRTSSKSTIVVGELGCLSVVLYDDTGFTPLKNTAYQIKGPDGKTYSGTTDDEGYLFHADVPIDDYELTVGSSKVRIPVVLKNTERHLERVIGFVIP
jgi:hypothetical protein